MASQPGGTGEQRPSNQGDASGQYQIDRTEMVIFVSPRGDYYVLPAEMLGKARVVDEDKKAVVREIISQRLLQSKFEVWPCFGPDPGSDVVNM